MVVWGALLITALITAVVAFNGARQYCEETPALLAGISAWGWFTILLSGSCCYALDYLRLRSLLGVLDHPLSVKTGLQAITVSEFASIVTPTAELHIPATVYVLSRRGVPVALATAAVVSKTLYMLLWVSVCALLALMAADPLSLPAWVADHTLHCAVPISLIVLFFLAMVFFAIPINRWIQPGLAHGRGSTWKGAVLKWLGTSTNALATIGRSTHRLHVLTHVASLANVLAYILCGYAVAHALGLELGFGQALIVFALSLMVTYLGIVPGSIGVTEVATAYLLEAQLSPRSLAIAILLRVMTRYVALLPGAFFFFRIFWKHGLGTETANPEPQATAPAQEAANAP